MMLMLPLMFLILLCDVGTFKEEGDDEDQSNTKRNNVKDPLVVSSRPSIRAREKRLKKALNKLVHSTWSKMDLEE